MPSRPPTLDELIEVLRLARRFSISQDYTGGTIYVRFEVEPKECRFNLMTTGSEFHRELIESLERLQFFTEQMEKNAKPEEKGATADDCIAFLNNELKNVPPGGLEGTMRRRLYQTTVRKLEELRDWRFWIDKARFDNLYDQERKRKAEEKARAEAFKQEQARAKAREDQFRDQFKEEARKADFEDLFKKYGAGFDAYTSKFYQSFWEDALRGGTYSNRKKDDTTFTWDAKKNWWEILGVPVGADKATIKSAWRKLAKQFHPDRNKDPLAGVRMAEINAAKDEGLSGARS
jgi:hypothetical protein